MSKAIENLQSALGRAMAGRPKVGGFPYLAETLRQAGVTRNLWFLPSTQNVYLTEFGPVVVQGTPLISGIAEVPLFNREALEAALRTDQAGNSTFPEFLATSWRAASSATKSISKRAPLPIMGAKARCTSKAIPRSKSS